MNYAISHESLQSWSGERRRPACRVRRLAGCTTGFTLVELIVAVGITAGLAAIMLTIVVNLLDTAGRASGSLVSSNQAQVALDFLAQDLESAVMRADGNVWLAATIQPDQTANGDSAAGMAVWTAPANGVLKPVTGAPGASDASLDLYPSSNLLEDYRFGMAGVWLRFFAVQPDNTRDVFDEDGDDDRFEVLPEDASAVRAVGYQMARYSVQEGGSIRYGLFRSWVRPHDWESGKAGRSVFEVGYNLFLDSSSMATYSNPGFRDANGVAGNFRPGDAGCIRRPDRTLLIANNVIDFGVRFYGPDSDGDLEILFPVSLNGGSPNNHRGFAAWAGSGSAPLPPNPSPWAPPGAQMSYGFPTVAEVFLRVLSDEGAQILEAYERNPFPGKTWWDVALENSRVYTRRVEMKGRVL
jgi:type II secretory pathway pseudopilin PulG